MTEATHDYADQISEHVQALYGAIAVLMHVGEPDAIRQLLFQELTGAFTEGWNGAVIASAIVFGAEPAEEDDGRPATPAVDGDGDTRDKSDAIS